MDILDKLISIRKEKKISRAEIMPHVGVNLATVGRYERRERAATYDFILRYADYLGLELKIQYK